MNVIKGEGGNMGKSVRRYNTTAKHPSNTKCFFLMMILNFIEIDMK